MEKARRDKSIADLDRKNTFLSISVAALSIGVVIAFFLLATQGKIILLDTPGMPAGSEIQKSSMNKMAEFAVLNAVTANLAQINPGNAKYQKEFLKPYLAPDVYSKIQAEIDLTVKKLEDQRELGSYYWVLSRGSSYDPKINKFFIMGDVHTVNAAKDTSVPYVYEYAMHVENYRPVIDSITSYPGDKPHNSEWIKVNMKEGS